MTEDTPKKPREGEGASASTGGQPEAPQSSAANPSPSAAPAKEEPVEVIGADPPGTGAAVPEPPAPQPAAAEASQPAPSPGPSQEVAAPMPASPPVTAATRPQTGKPEQVPAYLNFPNLLTGLRFALVFLILILLLWPWGPFLTGALIFFAVAAGTDWLDGRVARAFNMETDLGRMMDHIADKLLVGITMLALCANQTIDGINVLAAAIILAREIAVSGLREHLGARGISIPSSMFAKWKTTFQLVALAALMAAPLAPITEVARVAGLLILWVAMAMTLISGIQYVMATRDAWEEK